MRTSWEFGWFSVAQQQTMAPNRWGLQGHNIGGNSANSLCDFGIMNEWLSFVQMVSLQFPAGTGGLQGHETRPFRSGPNDLYSAHSSFQPSAPPEIVLWSSIAAQPLGKPQACRWISDGRGLIWLVRNRHGLLLCMK